MICGPISIVSWRHKEKKNSKLSDYLNPFWSILAILSELQGLDSRGFRPGPKQRADSTPLILAANTTHLHKMNGVTLLPDIATDTKTQAYKKRKLDSKNRSYIISIAKTVSKKIGALSRFVKFFSLEAALYLYKSTIRPCMKYCCHI